jgi:hypothetical protein
VSLLGAVSTVDCPKDGNAMKRRSLRLVAYSEVADRDERRNQGMTAPAQIFQNISS